MFDILGRMRWQLQTALGGFRVMVLANKLGDDYEPVRPPMARRIQKYLNVLLTVFL